MTETLRISLYKILEMKEEQSQLSFLINTFIMLLITVNVVAVILESVKGYQLAYGKWFWYLELFSISLFTVEYITRVWVNIENPTYNKGWRGRLSYMLSPMALSDFMAIVPFYLSLIFNT